MDSGPTRVEIELDEHETKRSRRRATPLTEPSVALDAPPSVIAPDEAAPAAPGATRRQLIATALAAGLVALFLGWSLGRSGGASDDTARTGGTTVTTDVTTAEAPSEPSVATTAAGTGDTLPAATIPSTTRPQQGPTTTVPPAWVEASVEIDPRLAGQADRIVAVRPDGGLLEIDLRTASMRTLERSAPTAAVALPPIAGDDWIITMFDDGNQPRVFRGDDAVGDQLGVFDAWQTLWDTSSDTYWERRWDERGTQSRELEEMTWNGVPTGRTIDTRGVWARQVDPTGGVIVGDGTVGSYRLTPDGSERIADGYVLAVGINHLLVYGCAERFDSCAISVLDRATGELRAVPADDDLAVVLARTSGWWGAPTTPRVNVDGTAAIVTYPDPDGQPTWSVLDLGSGSEIASNAGASNRRVAYPSGAWSADGRFAYVVSNASLYAVDRTTGDVFSVVTGPGDPRGLAVSSLTVRPA